MLKKLSKDIGKLVENEYEIIGTASNQVLQKVGLENTGNFVVEQLTDIGKNSSSNIEVTGQLIEGGAKALAGYITNNDELKQDGFADLNEGQITFANAQLTNINEKVEDITKIGKGLLSGNVRQAKDGATGLIGLKKSAVGLNILDDLPILGKNNSVL